MACRELETCGAGMAGFICNAFNAGLIPITALLSLVFYGELLGPMECVGVVIVFCAILVLTGVKFWKSSSSASPSSSHACSGSGSSARGGGEGVGGNSDDDGEQMKLLKD